MSARPMGWDPAPGVGTAVPQRLGKYLVSRVLGEGAMGVVYEALDPDIHRPVAIKAIRGSLLAPGAEALDGAGRFLVEAQAAGRLSHPNIVSVYEYGQTGDQRYIAMEYVAGVCLHEPLALGVRLPLADALSLVGQLLDALACAHAQGVWHRDIKPANLLLTPEGRLKVTDFGIARIEGGTPTRHTSVLGSPGYMAPERYTNDAPDARVDLFACGVLLYELLTGRAPFRGAAGAVMYQVLQEEPPAPSTLELDPPVPAALDAVVARAMAKRADDRYADAAAMQEGLAAAAAATGTPMAPRVSAGTMHRLRAARPSAPTQRWPRETAMRPSGSTPPPSAPSSMPGLPDCDAKALLVIEQLLLPHIGPMTRHVVRNATRHASDLPALLATLAGKVLEPAEREPFLARARRLLPAAESGARRPDPGMALPVLGTTPMQPGVVDQAARELAVHIGPIATVVARRAAAGATSREAYFTALVDSAGDGVDRKALLRRLWQLP